jgi:elongation factor G
MPDIIQRQPWAIEIAIEPKSKADQEKLGVALAELTIEDPSFGAATGGIEHSGFTSRQSLPD